MKITKIGHCCLLIELEGLTILTDPGRFSKGQDVLMGIDIVLITHEHADHLHTESVKLILKNNPVAEVIGNASVAKILTETGVATTVHEGGTLERGGVTIEAFAAKHAEIFKDFGQVQNTGFLLGDKIFYPGDSFYNPNKSVEVLALPVMGPWCLMSEVINYALLLKPRIAFPVHDGLVAEDALSIFHGIPAKLLSESGITFVALKPGDTWSS